METAMMRVDFVRLQVSQFWPASNSRFYDDVHTSMIAILRQAKNKQKQ